MGLLLGIAALLIGWYALRAFGNADPRTMAQLAKKGGGALALGAAVLLGLRGRLDMAIGLGWLGLGLLGYGNLGLTGFARRMTTRPGATSRVRSARLEMELDHDSGDLRGRIIGGRFDGRELNDVPQVDLEQLWQELAGGTDLDGARLLEAYLDRRFPGWGEYADRNRDAGPRGEPQTGAMTEQEAYQVLGLQPGAGSDDIRRAHRTLMKKLHPDQGGSTYLAARVNQAKDILMSRHR